MIDPVVPTTDTEKSSENRLLSRDIAEWIVLFEVDEILNPPTREALIRTLRECLDLTGFGPK